MGAIPPLRPLCLVLKIFLQQRELNEVMPVYLLLEKMHRLGLALSCKSEKLLKPNVSELLICLVRETRDIRVVKEPRSVSYVI